MYAELQCKSNFSFLRGASDSVEHLMRAIELGLPAIAITDVNGVYALPRAFEALKNAPEIKLISGCELRVQDHAPLTLLARDRKAYGLMCRMITTAHAGKEKGQAILSFSELTDYLSLAEATGLVGIVNLSLKETAQLAPLKEMLGDRFFLGLTRYRDGMDEERTARALALSGKFGIRLVATNDVHYHVPERARLQDALTCVREGVTLKTAGFKLFPNEGRHLKSPLEMRALFRDLPDAIQATLDIADACVFSLSELSYQYPSEWIPQDHSAQSYLEELVLKGAQGRYPAGVPESVRNQIAHEFRFTEKMGYADYFLTVYDIVDYAKKNDIYCQGRGAAANSIMCYCLGITVIDPVKMNLLFERFVSEERGEPPDIDVDFEHERREEVIQYIYGKYGRHRAAMISAVRTYRRRSAFLEMSKAVGVPVGTLSADELERDFDQHAAELKEKRGKIDQLVSELKGFPRHLSIHSCGFTISAHAMTDTVPIEPAAMKDRTIVQWDKNDLDTLGLIKIDVLSLGFLTAMHKACDLIKIHFSDIPQTDDPLVYGMIQRGDTIGTFQIESRAQIATLGVTQPRNFYDLVVEVALVRPGPNVGEMKGPYIARREQAKQGIPYVIDDPVCERILGRTYGVPIFQEQVMRLAIEKAGFSPGEADELRRAIAAWRSAEAVDALSGRFYEGLIRGGMQETRAKELFGYLKGFAAYGFPESHAASFAILSYLSSWLKYYHPAELLIGLLNSQPMGFYQVDTLINDAIRHKVKVLPIDPHLSVWDATLESKMTVRMGFRNVVGIQKQDVERLVSERARKPFASIHDFLSRTGLKREVVAALALADAFVTFGLDQRHSFWHSIGLGVLFEKKSNAQLSLFEQREESEHFEAPEVFAPMSLFEGIIEDYRSLGYSLRGNAMTGIRSEKKDLPKTTSVSIKALAHGTATIFPGVLMAMQRPPTSKGVCFITLEDEFGSVDLVLFKDIYERFSPIIQNSRFLLVKGTVERRGTSVSFMVGHVAAFASGSAEIDGTPPPPIFPGEHPRALGKFF